MDICVEETEQEQELRSQILDTRFEILDTGNWILKAV